MMLTTSRKEWGALPPKRPYTPLPSKVKGIKFHYTGGHVSNTILNNHTACLAMIRSFQRYHMNEKDWNDFAYNYAVCPHEVIIGRGLKVMSAANGEGLNKQHYAVLLLVGNSGLIEPPDSMKEQAIDLIWYIRRQGPCGDELKGHRDGYATDCPGDPIYEWVHKGCPKPKPATEPEQKEECDND